MPKHPNLPVLPHDVVERERLAGSNWGTWSDFCKSPAAMMREVAEGRAKVIAQDEFGRLVYELKGEEDANP